MQPHKPGQVDREGAKKMVIKAKYSGKCKRCGGRINPGDEIEWVRGEGSSHVTCPDKPEPVKSEPRQMKSRFDSQCVKCGLKITAGEDIFYLKGKGAWHADCTAAKEEAAKKAAERKAKTPWSVGCGSGYGGRPYVEGSVIRAPKRIIEEGGPKYLYVVKASEEYVRYDGMSFGVGDESGYLFGADCREATAEEAAPLMERERKAAEKKAAEREIFEIERSIRENGECPEGHNEPEGDYVLDTQNIYGGGDWFIIGAEHIWYVKNNGMDGDAWAHNNVRTGGAGAIGWRVPFDASLAENIRRLAGIIEAK